MAKKTSGKRGAVILLVVLAALVGGPSASAALPVAHFGPAGVSFEASWVEE